MGLDANVLQSLTKGSAADAWRVIINNAIEIASKPLAAGNAPSEVIKRDREIGALDHFLSASGWDLWQSFGDVVERTSDRLVRWWHEPYSAKAVLILDGLSLRELPWLLQGAKERGFTLHEVSANASELPGETNEFARALGFGSRSQLQNIDPLHPLRRLIAEEALFRLGVQDLSIPPRASRRTVFLVVHEEERFVPPVETRKPDGTSEAEAVLILSKLGFRQPITFVEPCIGVQLVAAILVKHATSELVRAGPGDVANLRRAAAGESVSGRASGSRRLRLSVRWKHVAASCTVKEKYRDSDYFHNLRRSRRVRWWRRATRPYGQRRERP